MSPAPPSRFFAADSLGGLGSALEQLDAARSACEGQAEDPREEQDQEDEEGERARNALVAKLQQVEDENLSHVLKKLDSIRQLAGDAQVLRHRENREQTARQVAMGQLYSLLLEDAGFQALAVMQRSVVAMFEGIKVQHAEVFFFSAEDNRKRLATGPSVRLKDVESNPRRCAERMVVTPDVLDRMLAEISTDQIRDILGKVSKYLTFKQTTYQVKPVEEREDALVKNATGFAIFKSSIFVADAISHCLWRVTPDSFTEQGNHKVELFAGRIGISGLDDGPVSEARFRSPMGVVVCEDTSTMFVADTDNSAIRRIDLGTNLVSTLDLELTRLTKDLLGATFIRPKGICVVWGDDIMFASMDRHLEKRRAEMQIAIDIANSSSGSSSEVSSSDSKSSFTSTDSEEEKEDAKDAKTDPQDEMLLSLEQSLTVAQIKKYAVLQEPPLHSDLLAKAASKPQKTRISRSSLPSSHASTRRPSGVGSVLADETVVAAEENVDSLIVREIRQPRLAVTTDHGVWMIDSSTGKAELIAGDGVQYGYHDKEFGLDSRFSSPKGIICIRSALFVADYWNDVVRCVNLYTTQVDTVMDFRPQGPVAMCLSSSGVLYTLDSDGIHRANILRIMSTQCGVDPATDTKYQKLFMTNARTRSSRTSISEYTDVNSEVWDAVRRKSVSREFGDGTIQTASFNGGSSDPQQPSSSGRRRSQGLDLTNAPMAAKLGPNSLQPLLAKQGASSDGTALSADFQNRLEAHLQQAADEQAVDQSTGKSGKRSRNRSKRNSREKRDSKNDGIPTISAPPALRPPSPTGRDKDKRREGRASFSLEVPEPTLRKRESRVSMSMAVPEIIPVAAGDGKEPGGDDDARDMQRRLKANVENSDYVDEVKQVLSRMGSRRQSLSIANHFHQDSVPLTLSDLGMEGLGSNKLGGKSRSNSVSVPEGIRRASAAMLDPNEAGKDRYLIFQEDGSQHAGSAPDAGTVMVVGGKAFYRAPKEAWSGRKLVTEVGVVGSSANPSRRASLTESAVGEARYGNVRGEDEEGQIVSFVDLTFSGSRRGSVESRRSSLTLGSGSYRESRRSSNQMSGPVVPLANPVTSQIDMTSMLQTVQTARLQQATDSGFSPAGAAGAQVGTMPPTISPGIGVAPAGVVKELASAGAPVTGPASMGRRSTENALFPESALASRRGSYRDNHNPVLDSRRGSQRGSGNSLLGSLQGVFLEPEVRRPSFSADDKRGSLTGPMQELDLERRRMSMDRRGSNLGVARTGPMLDRRVSQAGPSRRGSVMLMPTVFDNEEGERAESEATEREKQEQEQGSYTDLIRRGSVEEVSDEEGEDESSFEAKKEEERDKSEVQSDEKAGTRSDKEAESSEDKEDSSLSSNDQDSSNPSKEDFGNEDLHRRDSETIIMQHQTPRGSTGPTLELPAAARAQGREFGSSGTAWMEEEGKELLFSRMLGHAVSPEPTMFPKLDGGPASLKQGKNGDSTTTSTSSTKSGVLDLSQVPFTRDIDLDTLSSSSTWDSLGGEPSSGSRSPLSGSFGSGGQTPIQTARRATNSTNAGANATYKVAEQLVSKTWQPLSLPEPLSTVNYTGKSRRYPNTPLAITCFERDGQSFLLVGLVFSPTLLKVIPPKHHEPDRGGRFNTLPVDSHRFLLADESSHQVWMVNTTTNSRTHIAGCGKRGYLDGPLETCRMHSPCSLTLDPQSQHVYVADKGNHVIRKLDLLSGLASTVVGCGNRGNCDGSDVKLQALDSPFEVSFAAPHHLIISCADNAVRSFDLRLGHLKTLLIGA